MMGVTVHPLLIRRTAMFALLPRRCHTATGDIHGFVGSWDFADNVDPSKRQSSKKGDYRVAATFGLA